MPASDMLFIPPQVTPPDDVPQGEEIAFGGEIFGTNWAVRLILQERVGASEAARIREEQAARALSILEIVDRQMSPWIEGSAIDLYNALPEGDAVHLPEPMVSLVRKALSLRDETQGSFDPFLGAATNAWGFGPTPRAPGQTGPKLREQVADRLAHPAPVLDGDRLIRRHGCDLDLNGIAKGFAVDLVADDLRAQDGFGSVLVEIGGELKGHGIKPDAMPWWVDLDWSSYASTPAMRIALYDWACASSGTDERCFEEDGRQFSHILDPETGDPALTDLRGATVLDHDCWRADALATALVVLGFDRAVELASRLAIPCVLVRADGLPEAAHYSQALADWMSNG